MAPNSTAIGLDTAPEMVERAEGHAATMSVANVDFRVCPMGKSPLSDESVDVIISNGIISMSMEEHPVWDAWRALRRVGVSCSVTCP